MYLRDHKDRNRKHFTITRTADNYHLRKDNRLNLK